jgi:TolB-like protein
LKPTKKNRTAGVIRLPAGVTAGGVRRHLERVINSRRFVQSERMRSFLRHVVGETLDGRADALKEYAIGFEVFEKSADFDPRTDPIVRVEARRLRNKLAAYYDAEGRGDELRISLPKGSYVPRFQPSAASEEKHEDPAGHTVAVLPFANISSDSQDEYFSDGLTEELIHALTKVSGLQVVAWSSTLRFKEPTRDIYEIGRRLGVRNVVEGSVRRYENRLRVTVQLIDTRNGHYLWSESYDRRMADLFAIHDEISRAIAEVLEVRLAQRATPRAASCDVETHNLYLQGRYFWNKRTRVGMELGTSHFRRALEKDPNRALACAGLADCHTVMARYGLCNPNDVVPEETAAALKALELDPALGEAHASLGLIRSHYYWDWKESERHYRRAIELSPSYSTAHMW